MTNRMKHLPSYTDYFEIETIGDTYVVALSTALAVERRLEACRPSDWIEFQDVFGARHRLPALWIWRVKESAQARRDLLPATPGRSLTSFRMTSDN